MQRYHLGWDYDTADMYPSDNGDYVLYSEAKANTDKWVKIAGENQKSATLSAKEVARKTEEIKRYREALEEMVTQIANAPKGHCGDHNVYTMQISEAQITRWQAALTKTEVKPDHYACSQGGIGGTVEQEEVKG